MLLNKKCRVAGLVFTFVISLAFFNNAALAWNEPTVPPPGNNVAPPLNTNTDFSGEVSGKYNTLQLKKPCGNDQALRYNSSTNAWLCSDFSTGAPNLLSVLTAGSNASTYAGQTYIGDVTHAANLYVLGGEVKSKWINTTATVGANNFAAQVAVNASGARQLSTNAWADMSGNSSGYGLFGGNMYVSYDGTYNRFKYSNTHATIGAIGFAVNYPTWNQASVITSGSIGATADTNFNPVTVATFNYNGNVGINSTNPQDRLHVITPSNEMGFRVEKSASADGNNQGPAVNFYNQHYGTASNIAEIQGLMTLGWAGNIVFRAKPNDNNSASAPVEVARMNDAEVRIKRGTTLERGASFGVPDNKIESISNNLAAYSDNDMYLIAGRNVVVRTGDDNSTFNDGSFESGIGTWVNSEGSPTVSWSNETAYSGSYSTKWVDGDSATNNTEAYRALGNVALMQGKTVTISLRYKIPVNSNTNNIGAAIRILFAYDGTGGTNFGSGQGQPLLVLNGPTTADWSSATWTGTLPANVANARLYIRKTNWYENGTIVYLDDVHVAIDNPTNGGMVIGGNSVSTGLKLDVEGQVGATKYCDNNGVNCKAITELAGGTSQWANASSPAGAIYYNGGNVGIGSATPDQKLGILGNTILYGSTWGTSSGTSGAYYMGDTGHYIQAQMNYGTKFVDNNGWNFLSSAGNLVVKIALNGNIGVGGDSNPSSPLSFYPVTGQKIKLYDSANSVDTYGVGVESNELRISTSDGGKITFYNGYSGSQRGYIDSSGLTMASAATAPTMHANTLNLWSGSSGSSVNIYGGRININPSQGSSGVNWSSWIGLGAGEYTDGHPWLHIGGYTDTDNVRRSTYWADKHYFTGRILVGPGSVTTNNSAYKMVVDATDADGLWVGSNTYAITGYNGLKAVSGRIAENYNGTGIGIHGNGSGTNWAGYFEGGKGLYANQICLGGTSATDCKTSWPAGGSVAGSNTQVQFNNNGSFGASSGFRWENNTLKAENSSGQGSLAIAGTSDSGNTYSALYLRGNPTDATWSNVWVIGHAKRTGQATEDSLGFSRYDASGTLTSPMMIDKNGRVAIGNTTPTVPLTVGPNPTAAFNGNEIMQLAKTGDAYMTIYDGTGRFLLGVTAGLPFIGTQNATDFTFRTNNSEKARITSAGYLGIGTGAPVKPLDVTTAGGIRIGRTDNQSANNEIYFADNGQIRSVDDNHRIIFNRAANELELREYGAVVLSAAATSGTRTGSVVVNSYGLFGGNLFANYSNAGYFFKGSTGAADYAYGVYKPDATSLAIRSNNSNLITLASTGNVGINTATPGYTLSIGDNDSGIQTDADGAINIMSNGFTTGTFRNHHLYMGLKPASDGTAYDSSDKLVVNGKILSQNYCNYDKSTCLDIDHVNTNTPHDDSNCYWTGDNEKNICNTGYYMAGYDTTNGGDNGKIYCCKFQW